VAVVLAVDVGGTKLAAGVVDSDENEGKKEKISERIVKKTKRIRREEIQNIFKHLRRL
jgi:predicted NBD/HSP70 family sugar kinase